MDLECEATLQRIRDTAAALDAELPDDVQLLCQRPVATYHINLSGNMLGMTCPCTSPHREMTWQDAHSGLQFYEFTVTSALAAIFFPSPLLTATISRKVITSRSLLLRQDLTPSRRRACVS